MLVLVTLSRQGRLQVEVPAGASLGSGLSETESGAIALVSGTVISDGETISVNANRPETNSPQIGDDVIAKLPNLCQGCNDSHSAYRKGWWTSRSFCRESVC